MSIGNNFTRIHLQLIETKKKLTAKANIIDNKFQYQYSLIVHFMVIKELVQKNQFRRQLIENVVDRTHPMNLLSSTSVVSIMFVKM